MTTAQGNGFALKEIAQCFSAKTIIDAFEATTGWVSGGDVSAIATDSSIFQIGSNSLKLTYTNSTGFGIAQNISSIGDVSTFTGIASGSPITGYVSIKLRPDSLQNISGIQVRFGSDAGNLVYQNVVSGALVEDQWYSLNIDLSSTTVSGNPVWTTASYRAIVISGGGNCVVYADDMFISENVASRSSVPTINKNNTFEAIYEVTDQITPQ